MRKQLTQLKVDRIRSDPTKRIEISDHLLPQLRLIVQPSGARSWAVRTRIAGKTAKLTIGDAKVLDLAKARAAARAKLAEIAEGKDPRAEKRRAKASTCGGVIELYLKATGGHVRPKTRIERERHLRRDWQSFHPRPISEIRKGDVAARLLEIADQHGPIAANRSRTSLHSVLAWAVDQDLIEVNVVASTKRPLRREPTRSRVLTPEERCALWAATGEGAGDYNAIVRLLLLTGQRREEIAGMRWSELGLERATWSLPAERTKNGLPHLVPLSRQAVELIAAQERQEGRDYVFGEGEGPYSGWSRAKVRLDKRSGVKDWTLHDLRRSVVTGMAEELGIAPAVVEAVVNHQSGVKAGVAGVYDRSQRLAERTRALQVWADHVTAEPAPKVVAFPAGKSA